MRAGDAYERLKQALLSGEFKPGQVLREVQLAQWCGVSRTPVREALRRLEQDGLVHWEGQTLIVRRRSPEEILDIYATRITLEAMAAAVAAERRTDQDLRQLGWQLARCEAASPADLTALVEANVGFSQQVWHASHNESLVDLLERLSLHVGRYPRSTLGWPTRWEQSVAGHRALLEAISARDADGARAIAEQHFTQARQIRLAMFTEEFTEEFTEQLDERAAGIRAATS